MELKGKMVYVVNHFTHEDIATGYQIFATRPDAEKAEKEANRKGKKYGDYAYIEPAVIG